jgi:hypothetical protein
VVMELMAVDGAHFHKHEQECMTGVFILQQGPHNELTHDYQQDVPKSSSVATNSDTPHVRYTITLTYTHNRWYMCLYYQLLSHLPHNERAAAQKARTAAKTDERWSRRCLVTLCAREVIVNQDMTVGHHDRSPVASHVLR